MFARTSTLLLFLISWTLISCDDASFSKAGEKDSPAQVFVVDIVDEQNEFTPEEQQHIEETVEENKCGEDDEGKKVDICHFPPGNPENYHTVCVSIRALGAHIGRHGHEGERDYVGKCGQPVQGDDDDDHEGDDDDHDGEGHCRLAKPPAVP
ncbi:MAG: hypothetical protein H6624_07935 [Bdellovibrionaceae bacterium]|nr:hypothetical protein [Bdellovibrionales bacterium]MCB9084261.1 hypothetical protein [Pseudobdellovibrionaceae bacterium]